MSAEFIAAMNEHSGYYTFEHDVTRQVVGDAESIRTRLVDALEQMGYRVLNENPLQARRAAKSNAVSGCANDILDYQTSLSIGLKTTSTNSTRLTFDYTLKNVYSGYLSKGDRNTLTREAEAILALAMARTNSAHCQSCGADTTGSSRFCRRCGAPLGVAIPAEVEVLRLTSNSNASSKNIGTGLVFILMAMLALLPIFIGSSDPVKYLKLVKIFSVISTALGGSGLLMIVFGYFRLRNTIKHPIEQDTFPQTTRRFAQERVAGSLKAPDTNELAQSPVSHSITEGTTDLLPNEIKRAS